MKRNIQSFHIPFKKNKFIFHLLMSLSINPIVYVRLRSIPVMQNTFFCVYCVTVSKRKIIIKKKQIAIV